jgi:hypothetical protein
VRRAIIVASAFAALVALMRPIPSYADCRWVLVTETRATLSGFVTTTTRVKECGEPTGATGEIVSAANSACLESQREAGLEPEFCVDAQQAQSSDPVITAGLVLTALSQITLPESRLVVQPPNGRTMVNFDTNFYTVNEPFTRAVRLLGQRVELRIFPTAFTWRFDDGEPVTTSSPGAPYPDLQVTHDYLTTGRFTPSVDTTYSADWRVGDRGWQRVPGTVTIRGASVALEAVEVDLKLVY